MKAFLRIALVLSGILALAVGLIMLGRTDTSARPSADYYGPSGLSALAEILEARGFKVRSDRLKKPGLATDELAIAITLLKPSEKPDPVIEGFDDQLDGFLRAGGRVLVGQIGSDWRPSNANHLTRSLQRKSSPTATPEGVPLKVSANLLSNPRLAEWLKDPVPIWFADTTPAVNAYAWHRGVAIGMTDATSLTNRHIDKDDNAKLAVSIIESIAPGKKVVFLEAAHGDIQEPGLLEAVGKWLHYGWTQAMLALLVIAYALGKRFGLPVYDRFVQRGQRDLVEAVASLYQRAKADETSLHAILRNADRDIRRSLKLSFDAPIELRNSQIPDSLKIALGHAERVASIPESPPNAVLSAAAEVEKQVEEFIRGRTIIRPKQKRRAA